MNPTTKYFDTLTTLEELALQISFAVNNLFAVHEAMTADNFSAASFTDALLFTQYSLADHQKKLSECVDSLYAQLKEQRMEATA